jgi:MFS family permease
MTLHRPDPEPIVEDAEEALLEGDDYPTHRRGTARAALAHREFRLMWLGSFGSNVGTWMQQVVLGSYAYQLTKSSAFVGLLTFAQLGPLLLLSLVGGVVADMVDRRRLMISLQTGQMLLSVGLGLLVMRTDTPSQTALLGFVLAIGVCNALSAPAWSSVLPSLVGREDLPGAISLNSTMINGSRVIGPAVAGVLYPIIGAGWIFLINAVTYLFVIGALLVVRFPAIAKSAERGWDRLMAGFRVARDVKVVGRILTVLPLFSFFCLPFIGLFAAVAELDLGLNSKTLTYGLLYATFGCGAALGALSIGTVFAGVDKKRLVRLGLLAFAVALGVFGLLRQPAAAFPVVFVLGAVYFGTTTSMMTVLQATLDDAVRGRVMALWFMGFGGTVPLGAMVFGPLLDATSGTVVLGLGAVVALFLAWWSDLARLARDDERAAV